MPSTNRIQTNQLTGAALDWAVAHVVHEVLGNHHWDDGMGCFVLQRDLKGIVVHDLVYPGVHHDASGKTDPRSFNPSENWAHVGPLISRFGVGVDPNRARHHDYYAMALMDDLKPPKPGQMNQRIVAYAPSEQIAVCRAIVYSVLGASVEVPSFLIKAQVPSAEEAQVQ